jgi:hypothetical protein
MGVRGDFLGLSTPLIFAPNSSLDRKLIPKNYLKPLKPDILSQKGRKKTQYGIGIDGPIWYLLKER